MLKHTSKIAAACALFLVLAGWAAPGQAPAREIQIRVLSYNILSSEDQKPKPDISALLGIARQARPDIIALQECKKEYLPKIAQAAGLKHYKNFKSYGEEKWRSFASVALVSRWPFTLTRHALKVKEGKRFFGIATLDLDGIPISFYAVHLSREGLLDSKFKGLIKELLGKGSREEQMKSVLKQLRRDTHRYKILAGDLNTFPLSGPYRLLDDYLEDAFPSAFSEGTFRMDTLKSSKAKSMPNPKIDHIFHSKFFKASGAKVIKAGISDHYPIFAVLSFTPADQGLGAGQIQAAQRKLQSIGAFTGPIDGKISPPLRKGIARYQRIQGFWIDGTLTPKTLKSLK
jgi:endonuclease/exonuclease/phosphatase family metal-dependent hydrolase